MTRLNSLPVISEPVFGNVGNQPTNVVTDREWVGTRRNLPEPSR